MSKDSSLIAIKTAVGGERYYGRVNAVVENNGKVYLYSDILATVSYNIGYMQMDVSLNWDDDSNQISYHKLGLHAGYNSNFQEFSYDGYDLLWRDGKNNIIVRFE